METKASGKIPDPNTYGYDMILELTLYRLDYGLGLNAYEFSEILNPTLWARLCTGPKCLWVYHDTRLNHLRMTICQAQMSMGLIRYQNEPFQVGYMSNPNVCQFDKMARPNPFSLVTNQVQELVSLARYQDLTSLGSTKCQA